MSWTHVKKNGETQEQWVCRIGPAPACSLRRDLDGDMWHGSMLRTNGISTVSYYMMSELTLEQAKSRCEIELQRMGWEIGDAKSAAV